MKPKPAGIRWKIIVLFFISVLLSLASTMFLVEIVRAIGAGNRRSVFFLVFQSLRQSVGILPLGILTGFAFFILIFFLLSRRTIRYLLDISRQVQDISLGRFEIKIPVRSSDELGELAESVNRMTARLKASIEEERSAVRAKDELVTNVSHDLRTPLTSVIGYLDLLRSDKCRDQAEVRRYLDIVYEKSLRLKTLVDDLFEFATVSGGERWLKPGRIDLAELLKQLVEEFAPVAAEAGTEIRLTVPTGDFRLWADGDLLVRVFENLLSNAVRYGFQGQPVDVVLAENADGLAVEVANVGPPIASADLPRLFDRFFRSERSRSDRTGGSGLGLAIAKGIVDLHRGTISVESSEARTVFKVGLKRESD